jgi:hypothetical protein
VCFREVEHPEGGEAGERRGHLPPQCPIGNAAPIVGHRTHATRRGHQRPHGWRLHGGTAPRPRQHGRAHSATSSITAALPCSRATGDGNQVEHGVR